MIPSLKIFATLWYGGRFVEHDVLHGMLLEIPTNKSAFASVYREEYSRKNYPVFDAAAASDFSAER